MSKPLINLFLIMLIAGLVGCEKAESRNPIYPGKAEKHIVELVQVQFDRDDFNESLAGNPLDMTINILRNGTPLRSNSDYNYLSGTRGERILEKPLRWVINFDPTKNYQVRLEEISILATSHSYGVPKTPKLGYWPIGIGKIRLGRNSYLMFKDTVVEDSPDD